MSFLSFVSYFRAQPGSDVVVDLNMATEDSSQKRGEVVEMLPVARQDMMEREVSIGENNTLEQDIKRKGSMSLMRFAGASYISSEDSKTEEIDLLGSFQEKGYDLTLFGVESHLAGLVARKEKKVVIAFRGTKNMWDWAMNLKLNSVKPHWVEEGYIHSGFYGWFKDNRLMIDELLQQQARIMGCEVEELDVKLTGHSRGGAIAQIQAWYLAHTYPEITLHVETFGVPAWANAKAKAAYEAAVPNSKSIVQSDDFVAKFTSWIGYRTTGFVMEYVRSHGDFRHKLCAYDAAYRAAIEEGKEVYKA